MGRQLSSQLNKARSRLDRLTLFTLIHLLRMTMELMLSLHMHTMPRHKRHTRKGLSLEWKVHFSSIPWQQVTILTILTLRMDAHT